MQLLIFRVHCFYYAVQQFHGRCCLGEAAAIQSLPKCTSLLLQAFEAVPEKDPAGPSGSIQQFLTQLQEADPNDPSLSPNDNNSNFGHSHFTASSLTISTALK